jgi:hypothetical protein
MTNGRRLPLFLLPLVFAVAAACGAPEGQEGTDETKAAALTEQERYLEVQVGVCSPSSATQDSTYHGCATFWPYAGSIAIQPLP